MRSVRLPFIFLFTLLLSTFPIFANNGNMDDKPIHQALFDNYQAEKIAEQTYVIHGPLETPNARNKGFMNNPAFIISDTSVAVIDPGSSVQIGRSVIKHIRKITNKPITHIFDTHVHGDHWLGNQAFIEINPNVKIYAHPKMIELAKAGEAANWVSLLSKLTDKATETTKAVIPDHALEDQQVIKLGNISIKAHLTEYAHTKTDAMFEIVEDKVLFTGDNVTYKRIPRMNDGSFRGSITVIDKALTGDFDKIVPGHGKTGGKEVLESYRNYLSTLYETVKELREEDLEDFEMKDKIVKKLADYQDWSGFKDEVGKHISLAVLEAEQAEFE